MPADLWRHRARRAIASRLQNGLRADSDAGPHYVVCGNDPLAYRLVEELLRDAEARVTVLVPTARRPDVPDVRRLKGIRVIRVERLDEGAFRAAGLETADALGLVHQDDVGNLHAALCAQEVNANVRLVIRMFNTSLAQGVQRLFADCAVLSDAAMAAPAFVAASLGEVAPSDFRLAGRTLHVARRADVRPQDIVCGLADTRMHNRTEVLPADPDAADVVLAEATDRPTGTVIAARRLARSRRRRRPLAGLLRAARAMVDRKIGIATLAVLCLVVMAGAGLANAQDADPWQGVYLTLLTTIGGAQAELDQGFGVQALQVLLTVAGLALVPLITAAVVEAIVKARLALAAGRLQIPREGHVIVVGLGNVGSRVIRQLNDLGLEVVAIDKRADPRGASIAKQLDIPVIVGDAAQEETLQVASVKTCQALVVVSTDDVTSLEAALIGRGLRADLRVVLRLFDGDLAGRIQKAFNIDISHSVSYLAAPAFAAQMMGRDVLATIPLERHVLLVADVPVARGSALDGAVVDEASRPQGVRVIALTQFGQPRPIWTPPATYRIGAGDRLTVVARRARLSWLLARAAAPELPGPVPDPRDASEP